MKTLKYIFILLLILIIGAAVYFSLKDGTYDITEKKVINAPASVIYKQVSDFKNWDNWNPWNNLPEVSSTLGETTTGINGHYSFKDEYGNGSMTYTQLIPDSLIVAQMQYHTSLTDSQSDVSMSLKPVENGTEVTWNIKGEDGLKNKFFNFIFGLDLEKELRPMYVQGLENLEKQVQKEMAHYEISNPGLVDYGGGYILYKSASTSITNLPNQLPQMMQTINNYMQKNKIEHFGFPMSIYEKFDTTNNSVIFSTAIPVRDRVLPETDAPVLCKYINPTRTVKVTLNGDFQHLEKAWDKAQEFMNTNAYAPADQAPFEVYKVDQTKTENPAEYITEIYIPIQQPQE